MSLIASIYGRAGADPVRRQTKGGNAHMAVLLLT